jgi:hypothetical protein
LENLKERDHLEELGIGGRIILDCIFEKYVGRVWYMVYDEKYMVNLACIGTWAKQKPVFIRTVSSYQEHRLKISVNLSAISGEFLTQKQQNLMESSLLEYIYFLNRVILYLSGKGMSWTQA